MQQTNLIHDHKLWKIDCMIASGKTTSLPNSPLQYGLILVHHVISFGQDSIWKIRIRIEKELKLESFSVLELRPLDVFQERQSFLITLGNLIHNEAMKRSLQNKWLFMIIKNQTLKCKKMLTIEHFCQLTSSVTTSLFCKAMSQKDGTPFST